MCTNITESATMAGSARGKDGEWFVLDGANISYDHPYHTPLEYALNIDFVNAKKGPGEKVAVELTVDSARRLVDAILTALEQGAVVEARV